MKFFTLLLALSAAFYTCFAASCAFAQSAPETLLAKNAKDSSQPNVSVIEIESNPEVIVLIDNERIGATPVSIAIEPGKHEFELINTDNDIHIHKLFEVEAGKQASFSFDFDAGFKYAKSAIPKE